MNIAVDARVLGTGRAIDNYTKNLLNALFTIDSKNNYFLFVDDPKKAEALSGNFHTITVTSKKVLKDHFWFFKNIFYFDLMFHPDNTEHLLCLPKSVVTVHDVMPWVNPDIIFSKNILVKLRQQFYYLLQKEALSSSSKIITVTKSSKKDIEKYLGIADSRIEVTYESVGEEFKKLEEAKISKFRSERKLAAPFLFYVGGFDTRKNVLVVLEAFKEISALLPKLMLVLAGSFEVSNLKGGNQFPALKKYVVENHLTEKVQFTGYVSDQDLVYYYNAAECFVYPSLYEGFGLPVLEALNCGAAVVCSNSSSLPEVVGEAGLQFTPDNKEELVLSLKKVLTDGQLRESLQNKALLQAKKFSWEKVAQKTLEVFESL